MKPKLAIISGPTGAGKSALAIRAAELLGGEIINADSVAFHRGFNIGAAKPGAEDLKRAPHHLLDILEPDETFDAAAFLRAARPLAEALWAKKRPPLVVGGTGFYLRSLVYGLFEGPGRDEAFRARLASEAALGVDLHARLAEIDPETARVLSPADRVRIERALEVHHASGKPISQWQREHALAERPFETLVIVVDRRPEEMEARLAARTEQMFEAGLADEVRSLLEKWPPEAKPFKSIGYKETVAYLKGETTLDEAIKRTFIATRQLAKRQRTWFRGQMPEALWFHPDQFEEIVRRLATFFEEQEVL